MRRLSRAGGPWFRIASLLLVASAARCGWADETPPSDQRPNIVLMVIDDLGYADIGLSGPRPYQTPNLDRLMQEGMRFTDFIASAPVCSASRAALLTGCYHRRIGISGALGPRAQHGIHADETTLGELCRDQGYATACFGKWHLGHHPKFLPLQHGFDQYFGLPYSNDMWPHHPHYQGMSEHEAVSKGCYPTLPLLEGNGVIDPEVTGEDQAELTRRYTERAVAFIRAQEDRRFFLYVPHSMVHVPLYASARFRGQSPHGLYGDVMREVDWSVGQILDTLEETGNSQNTLVIFTSDNGPWLPYGNHAGSALPLREGKGTTFEGGCRLPTVMRWPDQIPGNSTCAELCCMMDVLPTVAEILAAPLPDHPIDGKSILELMRGEPEVTSPHEALGYFYGGTLQAVRDRRWKLHFPHRYRTLAGQSGGRDGGRVPEQQAEIGLALFDLSAEISERTDVSAEHPQEVARLTSLANDLHSALGDGQSRGDQCRDAGRLSATDTRLRWCAKPTLCVGQYQSPADGAAQLDRFRATFADVSQWQARRERTRAQVLAQTGLDADAPRPPLNPIMRDRRQHEGYTVESVGFEATPGFYVYGSLYRPGHRGGPHPAVLSLHGHWDQPNGGGRFRPDNQLRCAALARMGAVVLAIDMIGFGESARHGWDHESAFTMPLQLWSNWRAVDLLCSLAEVDPDRIAVTGASGGGTQTLLLALTDDRVAASVPVCMVSSHFFGGCVCESGCPIHLTPEHETNNADIAAAFAPKPQLLISVGGDWSKHTPEVEYPYVRDVYGLWDAEEAIENAHFPDEGHDYGRSKREAMYRFFAKHLGLDHAASDESQVTVESADAMAVFNDDFPLPTHARPANHWPDMRADTLPTSDG